jgi:hypothetical protein
MAWELAAVAGELDAQVPETAQAEHRDDLAGARRAAAQGVEGGHAGTAHWGRLNRADRVGDAGQSGNGHDHGLGVTSGCGRRFRAR